MQTSGRCAIGGLVALVLCLAISGCGESSTPVTTTSGTNSPASETSTVQSGKGRSGGLEAGGNAVGKEDAMNPGRSWDVSLSPKRENASHDDLSSCLGKIAEEAADDKDNPLVTEETAEKIFTFTIQEEEYKLPCPVSELISRGWTLADNTDMQELLYDPEYSFEVSMYLQDDPSMSLVFEVANLTEEPIYGIDMTVIGLTVEPWTTYVSVQSEAEFGTDTRLMQLLEVLGCNSDSKLLEDKDTVEYCVDLVDRPFYDWRSSTYGSIVYDWSKSTSSLTKLKLTLNGEWVTKKEQADTDEEGEQETQEETMSDSANVTYVVVEGV